MDGFTRSSLVFPSGMVWICAALVKVKQRPLECLGFLSWTNRIKREALTVYLRRIHQELHARPGGCDSIRPQVAAPSGFYFDPFHRTRSVHLIFRIIIKNESISCILHRRPESGLPLSSRKTKPEITAPRGQRAHLIAENLSIRHQQGSVSHPHFLASEANVSCS